ncbi:GNAT family N-acetyltransferase [Acinetobacter pittii]|uniref:GNAT family N-acetyltransferase n=1 Tax=Acinetobacter pittii TaxID=48296 RepID=UPI000A3C0B6E|nr:GNAT family N-acetyltransferase [Acinetobacter pittii]MCZ1178714.1 GNAT family N-acetyltransferase [Acinetobacter pittii]OTU19152.1 GNAT family N-acetyltransferase [Acinetobacter pittii]OTU53630.1 GNAT family N-acetyltransferase [Acinetobacter pittii]QDB83412.1 GNAT family N-acetyltransferase [Acinetobacter pittii]QRF06696.1 GNAT family N-acetyltransferase [Acinetobacter pittii]
MIIKGPPTSSEEYQLIFQWLDERFHYSIGAMAFLNQTQVTNTEWQLLRLYHPQNSKQLLGVAVILAGGTCFWVPAEKSSSGALLCTSILELQPRRIVTTAIGRDLLNAQIKQKGHILREYDQWIMVCSLQFSQAQGRLAELSDIFRLNEYQHQYNKERSVNEAPNWESLIQQQKIIVLEADEQIVSIVRLGIETDRLVSIGGTYTFPAYRRKGFAERVLKFAVNRIVATGRIAHLIVDVDNTPAVTLYRQMGFECIESSYIGYPEYL